MPSLLRVLRSYGLTEETYRSMLTAQGNVCPICTRPPTDKRKRWCLDHDHVTGRLRGIVCLSCNIGLGQFSNNPYILRRAAEYIERHIETPDGPRLIPWRIQKLGR